MRFSQIVVKQPDEIGSKPNKADRLTKAYKQQRSLQELELIELRRANVVVVDPTGRIIKLPLLAEH